MPSSKKIHSLMASPGRPISKHDLFHGRLNKPVASMMGRLLARAFWKMSPEYRYTHQHEYDKIKRLK